MSKRQSWNFIDMTGKTLGQVKVIRKSPTPYGAGNGQAHWECLCGICGSTFIAKGQDLRTGRYISCGCARTKIKVGDKYGMLLVLEKIKKPSKGGFLEWKCLCDCGQKCIKGSRYLTTGLRSCGCLRRKHAGVAARNSIISAYRTSARYRKLSFNLSNDELDILFQGNCHYCGCAPYQESKPHLYTHGAYIYNGIDRMDNNRGYEPGNVVSCCGICNLAKRKMSYNSFLKWLKRIAKKWG